MEALKMLNAVHALKALTWIFLVIVFMGGGVLTAYAQAPLEATSFKDVMVRNTGFKKTTEGLLNIVEQRLAILQDCQQQRMFWDGTMCSPVFNFFNPTVNSTTRNVEVRTFLYSGSCCRRRWGWCRSTYKHVQISCSEPPGINYYMDGETNVITVDSVVCLPRQEVGCPLN